MAIPELSVVQLRSGRVEQVDRYDADAGWQPVAGLQGSVVHVYSGVPLYIVEIASPPDGRTLALLDVREEDLDVVWNPEYEADGRG